MKIEILTSAKQDLFDGYEFYERQLDGLGSYFLDSIFSDIDSLLITAGIHPIRFESYHRLLSKRFPFAIYYTYSNNFVRIYAILDCRRNPAWIKNRF